MLIFYNSTRHIVTDLIKRSYKGSRLFTQMTAMEGDTYLLKHVVKELESFADPKLAAPWDNVGLLVEPTQPHHVTKVLLTNDLTMPVVLEALELKTNMIISYHPPIFAPLKHITQASWKEKIIAMCLENRIAVYSPHTAWDATNGAVGDSLASAFGDLRLSVDPIIPNSDDLAFDVITSSQNKDVFEKKNIKIIYSLDSSIPGKKVFRIVSDKKVANDIANLPDTIVTQMEQLKKDSCTKVGMGRKVKLREPGCTLSHCVELIKCYTGLNHVRLVKGISHNPDTLIKTVALVPGSGGSLLKGVGVDLFVTGEMLHHDLLDASHQNTSVILTNHSDSERPFLTKFKDYLCSKLPGLNVLVSTADKDPVETV